VSIRGRFCDFNIFGHIRCSHIFADSSLVQGWYRRNGRDAGIIDTLGGTVTFAQRFGSALNLNPHFLCCFHGQVAS